MIGRIVLGVFLITIVSLPAVARQADGALGLIRVPNSGQPAIVMPGDRVAVHALSRGDLQLVADDATQRLKVDWNDRLDGSFEAEVSIPEDTPSGTYALSMDYQGEFEHNARAVYVIDSFPERYQVAHITDAYIGRDDETTAELRGVIHAINARYKAALVEPEPESEEEPESIPLPLAFVLFTGDLTADATPKQFSEVVDLLDECLVPTFVVPGVHDANGLVFESFFGPATYRFVYGDDGYLAFDTRDLIPAEDAHPQQGLLERFRRELMPRRWSIGFTHRYDPKMGMRAQMTLFVDAPLDHLLFGHWGRANTDEERATPWGHTGITVSPPVAEGSYRLLEVGPYALRPGPVETVNE